MDDKKPKYLPSVLMAMMSEATKKAEERIKNDKYGTVRGHVVGSDLGVDKSRRQPRNAQCVCDSGKKAKKCCVTYAVAFNKKEGVNEEDQG